MSVEAPNFGIVGPDGRELKPRVFDEEDRPQFYSESRLREITPENKALGAETLDIYSKQISRTTPWNIRNGRIDVAGKPQRVVNLELPQGSYTGIIQPHTIITEDLHKETISDEAARVLAQFKAIEDYLPDFMGRSTDLFIGNLGITASYWQWGKEELQHSQAAALILEQTGHKTTEELAAEQQKGLAKTWELPFSTGRQVILYAVYQELMTRDAYKALGKYVREENDAPITASILELIARDEAYHGGGYMKFARIYYDHDPEGTVQDALDVASQFTMPALNLLPKKRSGLLDAVRVGVYDDDMGQEALHKSMRSLGFLPEDMVEIAAEEYGQRQDKIKQLSARLNSGDNTIY